MVNKPGVFSPETSRTIGPDSFSELELDLIDQQLRAALKEPRISAEKLVVQAMYLQTERPRVYREEAKVLRGNPLWYNSFYTPEVANMIGFVHAAVGHIFQNDELRLNTFQSADNSSELSERELCATRDELHEATRLPTFAARNIGTHPANLGTDLSDIADMWHIQLHFEGHPGPQNFFNALTAIQKQINK